MDLEKYQEGQLLLINKPYRWTSFDVVKKLRIALRVKKIGHAGTLDPLATGLLLIGTGKFTKKLAELQGLDKTYSGIIGLGHTTASYDLESPLENEISIEHLTEKDIAAAAASQLGDISQIPPAHSAVKVGGERAYKKARKKEAIKMEPRKVKIHAFDIEKIENDEVHFHIHCSKGTYIRSMAHDLGKSLGVGGYLKKLVRTSIGSYELKDAHELEQFIEELRDEAN